MIDLHIHTTFSDGSDTPKEIIELAKQHALSQIAITDHNCLDGSLEALKYLDNKNIDFIIGVELSCFYHNQEVHLLGYFNQKQTDFDSIYQIIQQNEQYKYNSQIKIIEKLNENGFVISYQEIVNKFPSSMINRVHIAKTMVEKNYVSTINEAFNLYIGKGKCCYEEKQCVDIYTVIDAIHACNGIAILAHPYLYVKDNMELFLLDVLKQLDGLEAIHSKHNKTQQSDLIAIANKYHKQITGGSDYHGSNKPEVSLGMCQVPNQYKLSI